MEKTAIKTFSDKVKPLLDQLKETSDNKEIIKIKKELEMHYLELGRLQFRIEENYKNIGKSLIPALILSMTMILYIAYELPSCKNEISYLRTKIKVQEQILEERENPFEKNIRLIRRALKDRDCEFIGGFVPMRATKPKMMEMCIHDHEIHQFCEPLKDYFEIDVC